MNEFVQGIFVALIPALIVSVITAHLTVKLSLKQFYSQKWWEKKAEAYSNIIEHLSYLEYSYGEWFDDCLHISTLSDERTALLRKGYIQSIESIKKAAAAGSYIVSEETSRALQEFLMEKEKDFDDPFDDIENSLKAVKICISKIRECAKLDLHMI